MKPYPTMKTYTAVIERCSDTGFYVGYVPGFPGAHSQGRTLDELNKHLREVIEMLLEEGKSASYTQFVGIQNVENVASSGICWSNLNASLLRLRRTGAGLAGDAINAVLAAAGSGGSLPLRSSKGSNGQPRILTRGLGYASAADDEIFSDDELW